MNGLFTLHSAVMDLYPPTLQGAGSAELAGQASGKRHQAAGACASPRAPRMP